MAYIWTANVLDELNISVATFATVPAVNINAADSPIIRPIASTTPEKIPGNALGNIILKMVPVIRDHFL